MFAKKNKFPKTALDHAISNMQNNFPNFQIYVLLRKTKKDSFDELYVNN